MAAGSTRAETAVSDDLVWADSDETLTARYDIARLVASLDGARYMVCVHAAFHAEKVHAGVHALDPA